MDLTAFEEDRKTYDNVERCLERISEAAAKLGDMALHLMPDQPWQKIRAFGNVLRHEYDEIREDKLFEIVKSDLPGLHAAALEALRRWDLFKEPWARTAPVEIDNSLRPSTVLLAHGARS